MEDLWHIVEDIRPSATGRFIVVQTRVIDTNISRTWPCSSCDLSVGDKVSVSELYSLLGCGDEK